MEQIDIDVWQDGMCVAKVSAHETDAMREAAHYAFMYGQDGPVEVFRVKRGKRTRIAELSMQPNAAVKPRSESSSA